MKKKLTLYIILITAAALLVMFGLDLLVTRNSYNDVTEKALIEIADSYVAVVKSGGKIECDGETRVTVISADGTVLSDTSGVDLSSLENHLSREEIKAAAAGKPRAVIRQSSTLVRQMMYYAVKVDLEGGGYVFVRASLPTESVSQYFGEMLPLLALTFIGALCVAALLSSAIARRAVRPYETIREHLQDVGSGFYAPSKLQSRDFDEINGILSDIDDISRQIDDNLASANEERAKLDYVLNNINDGIVAVSKGELCLVNKKAAEIFGATTDLLGRSVECLTADEALVSALKECERSQSSTVIEINVEKSVYLVTVKPLEGFSRGGLLAIAILTDVTSARNSEKLRSEFFANASHELKTPLTAIKGFNEILEISNTDDKLEKPIAQIKKEADRMNVLIDDMLKLARLESGEELVRVKVDLRACADEVADSISTIAAEKKVEVIVSGNAEIEAEQNHAYELIKNLAENAVKYNIEGGKVKITLSENEKTAKITVSDTGIGIERKNQARIFERFYRVEKSRSRLTGGTGLGLSIVKHICLLYKAELTMESRLGLGTTVTVAFNKESANG